MSKEPRSPEADDEDDFAGDEDEKENLQLESSGPQRLLWPILFLVALAFVLTASFPLMYMLSLLTQRLALGTGNEAAP